MKETLQAIFFLMLDHDARWMFHARYDDNEGVLWTPIDRELAYHLEASRALEMQLRNRSHLTLPMSL